MSILSERDWETFCQLARSTQVGDEEVHDLRRRAAATQAPAGGPLTLIAGDPDGSLDVLIERWLGEPAAGTWRKSAGKPLVVGQTPETVQPRMAAWPVLPWTGMAEGHLVIVGAKTALSQSMRAQIASLGLFDQVIFVTRYSRALPQSERELIGSITTLAATARVLALVYAGERPAEEDLAKVHKYVLTQMHKNGYADSRLAEGGFWFVDGGSGPFVVSSPAELLTIPHEKIEAARSETLRREAGDLLGKIAAQAETGEAKTLPPLTEEEVQKEEDHLRKALHDAYQRAELRLQGEPNPTDEQVRAAVLDAILQWGSHVGLEGIWLQFMEKVRPGSEAGLFNEAREAARELSIIARRISPQPGALAPKEGRRGLTNIKTQALRGGVAMAGGLIAYGAANLFDASRGEATFALLAGACVCFAVGEYLIKPAAALPEPREEAKETPTRGPAPGPFDGGRIGNYSAFAERLRAWFAGHVRVSTLNVAAQCRALGERLQPGTGGAL